MPKIRILLADDHPFLRLGLSTLIAVEKDMTLVGEAENGEEAIRAVERLEPDVVIMDLLMPTLSGAEATKAICRDHPATRVLVLTSFGASHDLGEAMRNGATGALLKDAAMDDFVNAIRRVAQGETCISPEVLQLLREEDGTPPLTQRQLDVLESAMRGLSDREIAIQFGMTHSGAKHHMRAIFAKLGAANRSEAIGIAMRRHLFTR